MNEEKFLNQLFTGRSERYARFPEHDSAIQFIDRLFKFLFGKGNECVDEQKECWYGLHADLQKLLTTAVGTDRAKILTKDYFNNVPKIYNLLLKDADAILKFDPAAKSIEEVIVSYPGFYATVIYRLSHELWLLEVPILPRIWSEYAHSKTGIDIHPGARIGESFFIDHGTGVVIGETAIIGDNVKIYQGVTLGALNVSKEKAAFKRHPTIGNGVVIYSGATILGGKTVVGDDSIIGGNVWLTKSVAPKSVVYHKSEVSIRVDDIFEEPLNFVI